MHNPAEKPRITVQMVRKETCGNKEKVLVEAHNYILRFLWK